MSVCHQTSQGIGGDSVMKEKKISVSPFLLKSVGIFFIVAFSVLLLCTPSFGNKVRLSWLYWAPGAFAVTALGGAMSELYSKDKPILCNIFATAVSILEVVSWGLLFGIFLRLELEGAALKLAGLAFGILGFLAIIGFIGNSLRLVFSKRYSEFFAKHEYGMNFVAMMITMICFGVMNMASYAKLGETWGLMFTYCFIAILIEILVSVVAWILEVKNKLSSVMPYVFSVVAIYFILGLIFTLSLYGEATKDVFQSLSYGLFNWINATAGLLALFAYHFVLFIKKDRKKGESSDV